MRGMAPAAAADAAAAGATNTYEAAPAWFDATKHQLKATAGEGAVRTKRQRVSECSAAAYATTVPPKRRATENESACGPRAVISQELSAEEDAAWLRTFEGRFRTSLTDAIPGRVCVLMSLASAKESTSSADLERAARSVQWPEHQLVWHGAKAPHLPSTGLGFAAEDLYGQWAQEADGAKHTADSGWILVSNSAANKEATPVNGLTRSVLGSSSSTLTICFSMNNPADSDAWDATEVLRLASKMHHDIGASLLAAVRIHIVSGATKLPLVALPGGLSTFHAITPEMGVRLLHDHGMCCFPGALGSNQVASLRRVVSAQIARIEAALCSRPHCGGIGGGRVDFSEVMHRGTRRWDMLLVRDDGSRVGTNQQQQNGPAETADYALLERVMRDSPWVPVLRAALGGTDDYTCQAGAIVSRPGAPCGKWQ